MVTHTVAQRPTPAQVAPVSSTILAVVRQTPLLPMLILVTVVVVALCADLLAPHDPEVSVKTASGRSVPSYQPPFWMQGGSLHTPLGTDFHSRDILSRLIYGARVSLLVGVIGTLVAGAIGTTLGILAGYLGGWVDQVIMRITDAWMALPTLIFAIFLASVFKPSLWNIVVILAVVFWSQYTRIIRGQVLSLRERPFVQLAQVTGASTFRTIRRHILPNVLNTVMVLFSLTIGVAIIIEASLSFLGVGEILAEPLDIHTILSRQAIRARVGELLELVGLPADVARLFPHEFSGGQRQRIAIARALATQAELIVLDEPVSALDVSIRAHILGLLEDLQRTLGVSYLFIGHDLAAVAHISHRIAVMYLGKIVELADSLELCVQPRHPYTQALFAASLPSHPDDKQEEMVLSGEVPSALHPPAGCRFHPRCPFVMPQCSGNEPLLKEVAPGHLVACYLT